MEKTEVKFAPYIYVACLSAYNDGCLHADWIDATQDEEAIMRQVEAILTTSPEQGAEGYFIHAHDEFAGASVKKEAPLADVIALARFIAEHGALGGALVERCGEDLEEARKALGQRYCGCFPSLADYMRESTKWMFECDAGRACVDWEAMGRDAEQRGALFTIELGDGAVHVIWGQ